MSIVKRLDSRESDAMTGAALTDEVIRQFLPGELDDGKRQRVEEVFVSDPETRDRILMTEDDLIEDYLAGCLSPVGMEKFLAYYLCTSPQRRRLRIAKSLRDMSSSRLRPVPLLLANEVLRRIQGR